MDSSESSIEVEISNHLLVDTAELLSETVATLYDLPTKPPSLYVDLEGFDLCRYGRVSLVSIYASPLKKAFIIDVHVLKDSAFTTGASNNPERTLKTLLEDEEIPKVLFDCRNDGDALYNLHNVNMAGE